MIRLFYGNFIFIISAFFCFSTIAMDYAHGEISRYILDGMRKLNLHLDENDWIKEVYIEQDIVLAFCKNGLQISHNRGKTFFTPEPKIKDDEFIAIDIEKKKIFLSGAISHDLGISFIKTPAKFGVYFFDKTVIYAKVSRRMFNEDNNLIYFLHNNDQNFRSINVRGMIGPDRQSFLGEIHLHQGTLYVELPTGWHKTSDRGNTFEKVEGEIPGYTIYDKYTVQENGEIFAQKWELIKKNFPLSEVYGLKLKYLENIFNEPKFNSRIYYNNTGNAFIHLPLMPQGGGILPPGTMYLHSFKEIYVENY